MELHCCALHTDTTVRHDVYCTLWTEVDWTHLHMYTHIYVHVHATSLTSHCDLVLQYGKTALYKASWNGRLSVVKTLLEHGASVDMQTDVRSLYPDTFT